MKSTMYAALTALVAQQVAAHATWQELWVDGVDQISLPACHSQIPKLTAFHGSTCVRLPSSNSPITDVTSNDMRCNANRGNAASKCSVTAGSTVTIEMHQQSNDRSCANEAIGGAHYGPVLAYLSKVDDSGTADGSSSWFKVYEDTWAKASSTSQGSDDYWGTKDLNNNCGKLDFVIPSGLAAGDYLLRAEAIALHAAGSVGGAQFYMSCYQLTVTGGGSTAPAGVSFPGAYKATDPGIEINIYQQLSTYVAPGPAVITGGTEATAGKAGSAVTGTGAASGAVAATATKAPSSAAVTSAAIATHSSAAVSSISAAAAPAVSSTAQVISSAAPIASSVKAAPTTFATSVRIVTAASSAAQVSSASPSSGTVKKYMQCGGLNYAGATQCEAGSTCTVMNSYYSQCI